MYIKLTSSQIFDGYHFLPAGSVLILDERGRVEEIVPITEAGDDVQQFQGILSPGFINCHCHLELSHLKGVIPEQTGLIGFITDVMSKRVATSEEILESIEAAENEMIANGIVAVGDICNTTDTIEQKKTNHLFYHNFIEASGVLPEIAESRFNKMLEVFEAFSRINNRNSIVPHAPYSVSMKLLSKIVAFEKNQLLTMHNQETAAENELFMHKTGPFLDFYRKINIDPDRIEAVGKSSLEHFLPGFNPHQTLMLVHNVHTSQQDIEMAKQRFQAKPENLFFCLCPNANQYIGGVLPDLELFRSESLNIVLGTDSLASNHQLSIWSEITTLQKHFKNISLEVMLGWATLNGAKALCIEDQFGSFEKGKKPGVVHVEENRVERVV